MNWGAISEKVDGLRDRGTDLQKRLRSSRKRIALLTLPLWSRLYAAIFQIGRAHV